MPALGRHFSTIEKDPQLTGTSHVGLRRAAYSGRSVQSMVAKTYHHITLGL